ncbi:hypothetical protein L1277_001124 [Okibacterium sp. HSC-33S16]|uniref:hypothetical protein n=1 Tax=Okibacterium sp. HSC-33S16 TaxID=2910965 RepID=UPI0020A20B2C|nr:hypothetical protein [Okibacterium sp. HSC-33S16]MCP2031033.1 hypothetical protein [Okibacterium sp. HSC-33S16]
MLDSRDIGGLQGAPVHGPDNEKIGTVHQVFVDAVTGAPNWITLKTGFLGRHEIFAPLANATWDGEIIHTEHDKNALLAAPRLNADEGLSPHNEEALNRHFGISDVDTDGGTARPSDEYPERPELMERAAAQERDERAAQDSASDRRDDGATGEHAATTVERGARDDDSGDLRRDRAGLDEIDTDRDAHADATPSGTDSGYPATDDGHRDARENAGNPLSGGLNGNVPEGDQSSSGPRHAKPNPAL